MRHPALLPIGVVLLTCALAHPGAAQLPPPLGPPPVPINGAVTPAKALLGKTLFWDEQLSSSRTVACGSCHQAAAGGSDPRSLPGTPRATHPGFDTIAGTADDATGSPGIVARDATGALQGSAAFGLHEQVTPRLAPSHINAAYAPWLFWDGRAPGPFFDPDNADLLFFTGAALENQASGPPLSGVEMAHAGREWGDVTARIIAALPLALATALPPDLAASLAGRSYPELFAQAFGTSEVTASRIAMAIGSYERTLFSNHSPFDSLLTEATTLTENETIGFQLFQMNCAGCHSGALLTDQAFHYLGVRPAAEDSGRFAVSHDPNDLGAFRTPSLRNVALRPAFMHDGRFSTLEQVVEFYDRGGDFDAPNKDPRIVPLGLSGAERAQLVAFLTRPLTDPRVGAAASPFDQPALFSSSGLVPRVLAGGVSGSSGQPPTPLALEPAIAGNPTFSVGVYAALGGAPAVLVVDDAIPPVGAGIPATGSFARTAIALDGSGASGGHGSVTLQIPSAATQYGRMLYARWYVVDAAAAGGVAASAPFRFTLFGPHGAGGSLLSVAPIPRPELSLASAPNPFVARTTLRFELSRASRVRLELYDIAGRRVRQLYERPLAMAGDYAIDWDGRDDRGVAAPRGVYFARLETERSAQTSRLVRLD